MSSLCAFKLSASIDGKGQPSFSFGFGFGIVNTMRIKVSRQRCLEMVCNYSSVCCFVNAVVTVKYILGAKMPMLN